LRCAIRDFDPFAHSRLFVVDRIHNSHIEFPTLMPKAKPQCLATGKVYAIRRHQRKSPAAADAVLPRLEAELVSPAMSGGVAPGKVGASAFVEPSGGPDSVLVIEPDGSLH
jgi:hypothetical protein